MKTESAHDSLTANLRWLSQRRIRLGVERREAERLLREAQLRRTSPRSPS